MDLFTSLADQYAPDYDLIQALEGRGQEHSSRDFDTVAIRKSWSDFLAHERTGAIRAENLHFYVHIPFCNQVCSFCCYYTVALTAEERLAAYLKWLEAKLEFFAPAFAGRSFQTLYIGGGTPSILDPKAIDRLLGLIRRRYEFDPGGEATFEFNPVSMTPEKLDVIACHGFNRVSMGVQSLGTESLTTENRGYQTSEMVAKSVAMVQDNGKFDLNLDLIMGLRGDESSGFLDSMRGVMSLKPNQMCIYPLYPTPGYLNITAKKIDLQAYYRGLAERYVQVAESVKEVAAKDFYFSSNCGRIDGRPWLFVRQKKSESSRGSLVKRARYSDVGTQSRLLFGIGPTARSRIAGVLSYEENEGIESEFDPAKMAYRGQRLDERREMVGYILRQLRSADTVSLDDFEEAFHRDLRAEFAEPLTALQAGGAVRADNHQVTFSSDGRTRFLAGLRLCDPSMLEKMLVTDIVVHIPEPLTFRISHPDPAQKYLAAAGAVAMLVKEETKRGADAARIDGKRAVIQLFLDVFTSLAAKKPGLSMVDFMTEYLGHLDHYLGRLRKEQRFGALPLEIHHPRT